MNRFLEATVFRLVYLSLYVCSLVPPVLLRRLSDILFVLLHSLLRYRSKVTLQNLARAFPDKTYADIASTAGLFYQHLARLLTDVLRLFSISEPAIRRMVRLRNPGLLQACHASKRDVIAVTGHYGNWEYLNILPRLTDYEVFAVYKPLKSKLAGRIVARIRSRFGMQLIPAGQAARQLMRSSPHPRLSVLIADQYPGPSSPADFCFLNQSTAAFTGAEKLARATGAMVLYLEMEPTAAGGWEVGFSLITDTPQTCSEGEITAKFLDKLQGTISKRPELWLWSHRRWKTGNCLPGHLQANAPAGH
ncbi:lipid A biosynthesis acyltransferase [Pedobacter yulinensis]|uniref:Lipid A biosynthesis acyltransferase n=1 Tax=Pedobacter yulinensis TaxID=2126353 RepID=A0A2T3HM80_9SPHI|nr:lysophospholipid acyltransferase family protein [Pedobacter yulinensis]PST83562.1 lipid A biosynthesis acyltransferase [Pedobacter yulinensis]